MTSAAEVIAGFERLSDEQQQQVSWRVRHVVDIVGRKFDDEVTFELLNAGLCRAHYEGLMDAVEVCDLVAAKDDSGVAYILARAIREYAARCKGYQERSDDE